MKYQDCVDAVQAADDWPFPVDAAEARLADANINPATGLATDYLNHFNEAIMLLEMMSACPDCLGDFLDWRPMSYREHFEASRFKGRELAIEAYEAADTGPRDSLDALAGTMTAMLEATRAAMNAGLPTEAAGSLAGHAAAWLKPLVARAGAVINGEDSAGLSAAPQAVVDGLMKNSA